MKTTTELAKESGAKTIYACKYRDDEQCPCEINGTDTCTGNEFYQANFKSHELEAFRKACVADYIEGLEPVATIRVNEYLEYALDIHPDFDIINISPQEKHNLYALETK